jgi:hypothetical protein
MNDGNNPSVCASPKETFEVCTEIRPPSGLISPLFVRLLPQQPHQTNAAAMNSKSLCDFSEGGLGETLFF